MDEAKAKLESVGKTSGEVAKKVHDDFKKTTINLSVEGAEKVESTFSRLISSFTHFVKIAGTVVLAVKGIQVVLRGLLTDVGGAEVSSVFSKYAKSIASVATNMLNMLRLIPGFSKVFKDVTNVDPNKIISFGISFQYWLDSLKSLLQTSPSFTRFAKDYVRIVDTIQAGTLRLLKNPSQIPAAFTNALESLSKFIAKKAPDIGDTLNKLFTKIGDIKLPGFDKSISELLKNAFDSVKNTDVAGFFSNLFSKIGSIKIPGFDKTLGEAFDKTITTIKDKFGPSFNKALAATSAATKPVFDSFGKAFTAIDQSLEKNFPTTYSKVTGFFNKITTTAKTGLDNTINTVKSSSDKAAKATSNLFKDFATNHPLLAQTGRALGTIVTALGDLLTGAVGLHPKLKNLGTAASFSDDALIYTSKAVQTFGINTEAAQQAAGLFTTTLAAANAAITIVGSVIASVGEKILGFSRSLALAASQSDLAFKQLTNTLGLANDAMGQTLGTAQEWRDFAENLATQTGQTDVGIANLVTSFLRLEPSIKLSNDQLKEAITRTAQIAQANGNLAEVTSLVTGAFQGYARGLFRYLGAGITMNQLLKVEADSFANLAAETQGQINAQQRAAVGQQVFKILMRGTDATVNTLSNSTSNLGLALERLAASIDNIKSAFGGSAQHILAPFINGLTYLIATIGNLPSPVRAVISNIISLTGIMLTGIGLILKYAGAWVILSNSVKIFNAALTIPIGTWGTIGEILSRGVSAVLGTTVKINSAAGVFGAAVQVLLSSTVNLITGIGNLVKAILTFNLSSIITGFIAWAKSIDIAAKSLALLRLAWLSLPWIAVTLLIIAATKAVSLLDDEFGTSKALTDEFGNSLESTGEKTSIWGFAIAKLTQLIDSLAIAIAALATAFAAWVFLMNGLLIDVIELVAQKLDKLTLGVFNFTDRVTDLLEPVRDLNNSIKNQLVKSFNNLAEKEIENIKNLISANTKTIEYGQSIRRVKSDLDEYTGSLKEHLATFLALDKKISDLANPIETIRLTQGEIAAQRAELTQKIKEDDLENAKKRLPATPSEVLPGFTSQAIRLANDTWSKVQKEINDRINKGETVDVNNFFKFDPNKPIEMLQSVEQKFRDFDKIAAPAIFGRYLTRLRSQEFPGLRDSIKDATKALDDQIATQKRLEDASVSLSDVELSAAESAGKAQEERNKKLEEFNKMVKSIEDTLFGRDSGRHLDPAIVSALREKLEPALNESAIKAKELEDAIKNVARAKVFVDLATSVRQIGDQFEAAIGTATKSKAVLGETFQPFAKQAEAAQSYVEQLIGKEQEAITKAVEAQRELDRIHLSTEGLELGSRAYRKRLEEIDNASVKLREDLSKAFIPKDVAEAETILSNLSSMITQHKDEIASLKKEIEQTYAVKPVDITAIQQATDRITELEKNINRLRSEQVIVQVNIDIDKAKTQIVDLQIKATREALDALKIALDKTSASAPLLYRALGLSFDPLAEKISVTEDAVKALISRLVDMERIANDPAWKNKITPGFLAFIPELRDQIEKLSASLQNLKVDKAIADINKELAKADALSNRKKSIFGKSFDLTDAQISDVTNAINAAIEAEQQLQTLSEGVATPEQQARLDALTDGITRLRAHLKELEDVQDLKNIFQEVFDGLRQGIADSVRGVVEGTQTMSDAFKNLARNILLTMSSRLMQRAFKPLEDAFDEFLTEFMKKDNWFTRIFGGGNKTAPQINNLAATAAAANLKPEQIAQLQKDAAEALKTAVDKAQTAQTTQDTIFKFFNDTVTNFQAAIAEFRAFITESMGKIGGALGATNAPTNLTIPDTSGGAINPFTGEPYGVGLNAEPVGAADFFNSIFTPFKDGARATLDALQNDIDKVFSGRLPDKLIDAVMQSLSATTSSPLGSPAALKAPQYKEVINVKRSDFNDQVTLLKNALEQSLEYFDDFIKEAKSLSISADEYLNKLALEGAVKAGKFTTTLEKSGTFVSPLEAYAPGNNSIGIIQDMLSLVQNPKSVLGAVGTKGYEAYFSSDLFKKGVIDPFTNNIVDPFKDIVNSLFDSLKPTEAFADTIPTFKAVSDKFNFAADIAKRGSDSTAVSTQTFKQSVEAFQSAVYQLANAVAVKANSLNLTAPGGTSTTSGVLGTPAENPIAQSPVYDQTGQLDLEYYLQDIESTAAKGADMLSETGKNLSDGFGQLGTVFVQGVSQFITTGKFNLQSAFQLLSPILSSGIKDLLGVGNGEFTNMFKDLGSSISNGLNSLLNTGQTGFSGLFSSLGSLLSNGLSSLTSGIGSLLSGGGDILSSIFSGIGSVFSFFLAEGGKIPGRPSKDDSVVARVSPGEYVTSSPAVTYYGEGLFDALNKKKIPKDALMRFLGGSTPSSLHTSKETLEIGKKLHTLSYTLAALPAFAEGGLVHPMNFATPVAPMTGVNKATISDDRPIQVTIIDRSPKLDPAAFKMKPEEVTRIIVDGVVKDKVVRKVIREDISNGRP